MSDVDAADADQSLGAVVQRCELQIAALAGRLDAESLRRSSATKEISSTVESQLLAVRSTIHGLAAVRVAVEKMGQEVAEALHHGWATESHAAALDTRVTTLAQSVESELEGLERRMALIHGTIDAIRAEIGAGRTADAPTADGAESDGGEQGLQDGAAVRGELAALRVTVMGAQEAIETLRGDLSAVRARLDATGQVGETLATRQVVETLRGEIEVGIELLRVDVGATRERLDDTARAADGLHGAITAIGADVGSLQDACAAVGREAAVAHDAIAAVRDALDERFAVLRAESQTELAALRETMRDDTARAVEAMQETLTAVGGDVGSLQDACAAVGREVAVARDAIAAVRDATDERFAGLRAESRTQLAELRDATFEAIAGLRAETQEQRATSSGELRAAMHEAIAGLRAETQEHRVMSSGELRDAMHEAIAGLRAETQEHRTTSSGELRDAMHEAIAGLRAETQEHRVTSSGELRDGMALLRGEIAHLAADLSGVHGEVDGTLDVVRQSVTATAMGLGEASEGIAAIRDELRLVGTAIEQTQGDARVLRDDLEAVRRDAAQPARAEVPEDLRALVVVVERLRSDLARQDAIVDERVTTSHRATEALRAELVEMRRQMNQVAVLMGDRAPAADARRTGVVEPLTLVLETLLAPVATVQAVAEQVTATLAKVAAVLEEAAAVLPAPIATAAASFLRRIARS